MNKSLTRFLQPKSIAVFGGDWAHNVVQQCQLLDYPGEIWPVHPKKTSVHGIACFASVDDLPGVPDACFIGVNRTLTVEIVRQLAAVGAGGAVCFASGFSEASDEDSHALQLHEALLAAAGEMPILGPNCYGLINCLDRAILWPDQHGAVAVDSGVALLTQSSNIAINLTMQTRGLPIAYVFTAGNQAVVSLAQLALWTIEDPRVTAIGLHIEGFNDVREYERLAQRAHELNKSVIAIKVGKSANAQQALMSHTSSLTGDDTAAECFLQRIGIKRVHSLSVLLETLKICHVAGKVGGPHILSMSCSGGEASLVADAAAVSGLVCPALNADQNSALRSALGPKVALANPLDYHTYIWNDAQALYDMFSAMLRSDADAAILVLDFPREDRCTYESWLVTIDAFKKAGVHWPGVKIVLASLPENFPESLAVNLMSDGIVPLCGLDDALMAIHTAGVKTSMQSGQVFLPETQYQGPNQSLSISEAQAKQFLRQAGVAVPDSAVVRVTDDTTRQQALIECAELQRPLVVKRIGELHKSDSNGVLLNVNSDQQLLNALAQMGTDASCLVEEQIEDVVVELLVGIVRDPVHGFLLTVGAGGVQTELLNDTCSTLLPANRAQLAQMLSNLNCFPVLEGYRGKVGCNMEKLLDTLLHCQEAAMLVSDELQELEINPLICTSRACIAADALMRVSDDRFLQRYTDVRQSAE
jgi:acyl-CoA synthetase (NDP forming)